MYFVVGVEPRALSRREGPARDAVGIVLGAEGDDVVRFVDGELSLCLVELRKQVGAVLGDAQIVVGRAKREDMLHLLTSVAHVTLHGRKVNGAFVECGHEQVVAVVRHHFRVDGVLLQVLLKNARYGAVQHSDLLVGKRAGIGGHRVVRLVLEQGIRLVSHGQFWIANEVGTLLLVGKARKQIDLALK